MVLLVTPKDNCIRLFLGESFYFGYVLGSPYHLRRRKDVGIAELKLSMSQFSGDHFATGAHGIRPHGVRPIGGAVSHKTETHIESTCLYG